MENGRRSTRGRRRKIGEVEESTRPKRNIVGGGDEEEKGMLKKTPLQDGLGCMEVFGLDLLVVVGRERERAGKLSFVSFRPSPLLLFSNADSPPDLFPSKGFLSRLPGIPIWLPLHLPSLLINEQSL